MALFPKNFDEVVPSHIDGMIKKWYHLAPKVEKFTSADKNLIKSIKLPKSKREERKRGQGSGNPLHLSGSHTSWNAPCGHVHQNQPYSTPQQQGWNYGYDYNGSYR